MSNLITISGVAGYIDENGVAQLNLENVARGLGFTQTAASGNEVIRWERVNKYLEEFGFIPTSGDGRYIPENIFYRLSMKASNQTAIAFQMKVANEILPSIRKTGFYSLQPKDSYTITDPIERAKAWIVEAEERKTLQLQIEGDKPFANFGKSIANSSDSITLGEFAKVCNNKGIKIGRNRLFDWMRVNGYLIKQGRETNNPKQCYVEQKLFEIKEAVIHTVKEDLIRTTTVLTGKGQLYFLDKLGRTS